MTKRKEGWYWVKANHENAEWEPARYMYFQNYAYLWLICGLGDSVEEESFQEIGQRISMPNETEKETERSCYHLMNVWIQYSAWKSTEEYLTHADMKAGEDAGEFLQKYGYVECDGYCDTITDKGRELLSREEPVNGQA